MKIDVFFWGVIEQKKETARQLPRQANKNSFFVWAGKTFPAGHLYNKKSIARIEAIFWDRKLKANAKASRKSNKFVWAPKPPRWPVLQQELNSENWCDLFRLFGQQERKLQGKCQGRQFCFFRLGRNNLPDCHFYNKKSIAQIEVFFGIIWTSKKETTRQMPRQPKTCVFFVWAEKNSQMAILQ